MKYLSLVWAQLFRSKTRTLLTLLSVVTAFLLFGMLDSVRVAFNSGGSVDGANRLVTTSRLSITQSLPVRLQEQIRTVPGVKDVTYVSPEMAMQRLEQTYAERGEKLDLGGAQITLYSSLEIALTDPNFSQSVANSLCCGKRFEVDRITTKQADYEQLLSIIGTIRMVGIVALILVGAVVLFMIVNTIRIAVYSRANEIEIMRLVGASDSFIRWPFILEGVLCGLIGGLVTIVLVAIVWDPIQPVMVRVFQMPTSVSAQFLATLSAIVLAVGLGVGAIGSWISVRSNLSAAA
jgi:cell division protein FtsX